VNKSHTVTFVLTNPNPVSIEIENFSITIPNTDIQLDYMELLNGNKTKMKSAKLFKNNDISQVRAICKIRKKINIFI
jgi:hypothetical protein